VLRRIAVIPRHPILPVTRPTFCSATDSVDPLRILAALTPAFSDPTFHAYRGTLSKLRLWIRVLISDGVYGRRELPRSAAVFWGGGHVIFIGP
jgi:hypothetical protein